MYLHLCLPLSVWIYVLCILPVRLRHRTVLCLPNFSLRCPTTDRRVSTGRMVRGSPRTGDQRSAGVGLMCWRDCARCGRCCVDRRASQPDTRRSRVWIRLIRNVRNWHPTTTPNRYTHAPIPDSAACMPLIYTIGWSVLCCILVGLASETNSAVPRWRCQYRLGVVRCMAGSESDQIFKRYSAFENS